MEDGWEPLCRFLGKEVPDEPFPHANATGSPYKGREDAVMKQWLRRAVRNMVLVAGGVGVAVAAGLRWRSGMGMGMGSGD